MNAKPLAAIAEILKPINKQMLVDCGSYFPSGAVVLPVVHVWPDEFLDTALQTEVFPIALVMEAFDRPQSTGLANTVKGFAYEWLAEICVLVAPQTHDPNDSTRAEMAMRGWVGAMTRLFLSNLALAGCDAGIGDGNTNKILEPIAKGWVNHPLGTQFGVYHGIRARLKVTQFADRM